MPYPVRYSTRSFLEYEEILDYVSEQFGTAVAARMDTYFEEVIDQIAFNPRLFPYSDNKKNLRRCVISPQTTLALGLFTKVIVAPLHLIINLFGSPLKAFK